MKVQRKQQGSVGGENGNIKIINHEIIGIITENVDYEI